MSACSASGKKVESETRGRIDQLDQEFRIAGLREMEMRHEEIGRHRGAHGVGIVGHEVDVAGSKATQSIARRVPRVQADCDPPVRAIRAVSR